MACTESVMALSKYFANVIVPGRMDACPCQAWGRLFKGCVQAGAKQNLESSHELTGIICFSSHLSATVKVAETTFEVEMLDVVLQVKECSYLFCLGPVERF